MKNVDLEIVIEIKRRRTEFEGCSVWLNKVLKAKILKFLWILKKRNLAKYQNGRNHPNWCRFYFR